MSNQERPPDTSHAIVVQFNTTRPLTDEEKQDEDNWEIDTGVYVDPQKVMDAVLDKLGAGKVIGPWSDEDDFLGFTAEIDGEEIRVEWTGAYLADWKVIGT